MEQMENLEGNMASLLKAIEVEGGSTEFTPDETAKSGRDYMIACAKNEEEERIHKAKVWKDASQIVIL
jgi:hypothetical protein